MSLTKNKMFRKARKIFFKFLENEAPYVCAFIIACLVLYAFPKEFNKIEEYYATTITILSILAGFLVTSWSVLVTRPDNSQLSRSKHFKNKSETFFRSSLWATFIAILVTLSAQLITVTSLFEAESYLFTLTLFFLLLSIFLTMRTSLLLFYLDKE